MPCQTSLMRDRSVVRSEWLGSHNGASTLTLQDDDNLVIYAVDGSTWATHTETDAPTATGD